MQPAPWLHIDVAEQGTRPLIRPAHLASSRCHQLASECQSERVFQQPANAEAIDHLNRGLELLEMLPATLERSQKKLALLTSLGPALLATRGFASKEVESTYSAAQARFQRLRGELTLAKEGLSAASEVEHDLSS